MKITKILFWSTACDPISLHEILPDIDKQDSIGEMRSSASELMTYIFDNGDKTREKSCGLQHNHLSLSTLQK
jgi:hypothetical protein